MAVRLEMWHPTSNAGLDPEYFIPEKDIHELAIIDGIFYFLTTGQILLYFSVQFPTDCLVLYTLIIGFLNYWYTVSFREKISTITMIAFFWDFTLLLISLNCACNLTPKNYGLLYENWKPHYFTLLLNIEWGFPSIFEMLQSMQTLACALKQLKKFRIYIDYLTASYPIEGINFGMFITNRFEAVLFQFFSIICVSLYVTVMSELASLTPIYYSYAQGISPFTTLDFLAIWFIIAKALFFCLPMLVYILTWLSRYPKIKNWRDLYTEVLYLVTSLVALLIGIFWILITNDCDRWQEGDRGYSIRSLIASFQSIFIHFALFHMIFHGCCIIRARFIELSPRLIDCYIR